MKKNNFCGLDFGTSNSTIGFYRNGQCELTTLQNGRKSIRSAIFYDVEHKEFLFGQEGITSYFEEGQGRLMMSLKSVLGSSLMEEETALGNKSSSYSDILGYFIQYLKKHAEEQLGEEITHVVAGRPVRFHDYNDKTDQSAQDMLESIIRAQGFKDIIFQYEPLAASKHYAQFVTKEELALIVDMGGGTSDFTLIRLVPAKSSQSNIVLANHGIHVAGTDLDRALSLKTVAPMLGLGSLVRSPSGDLEMPVSYYYDLTTWHLLNDLYSARSKESLRQLYAAAYNKEQLARLLKVVNRRLGHRLIENVEIAKQQLSSVDQTTVCLDVIEDNLQAEVTRSHFNDAIGASVDSLLDTLKETIVRGNISPQQITSIFYTGGTTKIPIIRERIQQYLPQAKIVEGDVFGSVGMGLTIEAFEQFS